MTAQAKAEPTKGEAITIRMSKKERRQCAVAATASGYKLRAWLRVVAVEEARRRLANLEPKPVSKAKLRDMLPAPSLPTRGRGK